MVLLSPLLAPDASFDVGTTLVRVCANLRGPGVNALIDVLPNPAAHSIWTGFKAGEWVSQSDRRAYYPKHFKAHYELPKTPRRYTTSYTTVPKLKASISPPFMHLG